MKFLMKLAEQITFIYKEKDSHSTDLDTKMTNFAKLWKAVLLSNKTRESESPVYLGTENLTGGQKDSCVGENNVKVQLYQRRTHNCAGQKLPLKGIKIFLSSE